MAWGDGSRSGLLSEILTSCSKSAKTRVCKERTKEETVGVPDESARWFLDGMMQVEPAEEGRRVEGDRERSA